MVTAPSALAPDICSLLFGLMPWLGPSATVAPVASSSVSNASASLVVSNLTEDGGVEHFSYGGFKFGRDFIFVPAGSFVRISSIESCRARLYSSLGKLIAIVTSEAPFNPTASNSVDLSEGRIKLLPGLTSTDDPFPYSVVTSV